MSAYPFGTDGYPLIHTLQIERELCVSDCNVWSNTYYVVRSHCSMHSLTHRPNYLQGVLTFDSLLVCRLAMNLTVKYSGTLTIVHIASFCCLGYVPVWLESYLLK